MSYRDTKGRFMTRHDYERTYGNLERETATVDLSDPEVREAIRDISRAEYHPYRYKQIHGVFYAVWIVTSALAIAVSFWLGTLAYRP